MNKAIDIEAIQEYVLNAIEGRNLNVLPLMVGCLPDYVSAFLRNDGVELESDEVYITTDFIRKYISHPKIQKNANIPFEEYYKAVLSVVNPKRVFRDLITNDIVIMVDSYNGERVIKSAVHIGYKRGKMTMNVLKSVGLVGEKDMDNKTILKEIKKGITSKGLSRRREDRT